MAALTEMLKTSVGGDTHIDLVTTMPNRYASFTPDAAEYEEDGNLSIYRVPVPVHRNKMLDQVRTFSTFFLKAHQIIKDKKYDLIIATSSKLLTGFLGAYISRRKKVPLYLDIRDIFLDTLQDVLAKHPLRFFLVPTIRWIERYTFKRADHINLVSDGFRKYFVERYGEKSYSFFPNGIDEEFLSYDFRKPDTNELPLISYVGNIG
ncbi:MAG: glycosyltransferase, partial [Bacteroidota bacterium]